MHISAWRYRTFHASYLLGWLSAAILIGLALGKNLMVGNDTFILLIILSLLLGAFRSRRWWAVICVLVAGLCTGLLRGQAVASEYRSYEPLTRKSVELTGTLSGDVQLGSGGKQKLTLAAISINGQHYPGDVFATMYGKIKLKRGDTVTLRGTVREGFASYGAAIANGKVISVVRHPDLIRDVRERFSEAVHSVVMDPMASLGLGFVVGQRSSLPDTLDEQLKIVGLTHIVVASGYNLTILVRFVMRLLSRYSRYLAMVGSLTMITLFVLFSGLSPSMNRAVIVTLLGLLAWYVGRRFHPVLLVLYVAAVTAFYNPMSVWADLGWYLSFFAFAGILVLAPLVVVLLYKKRQPSSFELLVIETLSAEVMALPLVSFAFSTVPVFSLIANVLVGPFIPAAMVLTALTGVAGMIFGGIASIIALPASILIGYMIAVVQWLAKLPMAQLTVDMSFGVLLLWYVVLLVGCWVIARKTHYNFRSRDSRLEI